MLGLLGVFFMMAQISGAQALDIDNDLIDGYIGVMAEVVCAAPRYGADIGMMPEVVVTAPRYEGEDIAYSGMMPEVVVTAPRYGVEIGLMEEVVVTAPRYEGEDIAYSGMMPEVVVTSSQHEKESIADGNNLQDVSLHIALIMIRTSLNL